MTGARSGDSRRSELYRRIVESSRDGIWVLDAQGRTVYANRRAAELLGRTTEEMAGLSVPDVLDAPGRAQFSAHLADLRVRGPATGDVECCYRLPDGSPVHLLVSETVLHHDDGSVAYVHRLTDDEERRALIDELSRRQDQLEEAQSLAAVGSWELDLDTGAAAWSRQMYVLLGEDPRTCPPGVDSFVAHVLVEDREPAVEALRRVREGGPRIEFDVRVRRRDGEVRWVRGLGRTSYDAEGRPARLRGTIQDITAVKEAELQLRDVAVLTTTMQMMATAANNAETLDEALELTRQQLLGHEDWQRAVAFTVRRDSLGIRLEPWVGHRDGGLPADDLAPTDAERRLAWRALTSGATVFEEAEQPRTPSIGFLLRVGGDATHVVVITARSPFERHAMLRSMVSEVAGQLARVASRERAAAELAAARDTALEASRLKSEFLAMMSHEIRTPMNGVIGLNELLLGTRLDPHQRRLAEGAQLSGRALLGIINDVLDFSKIEAGELTLESVELDPRAVLEQVRTTLEGMARDKGVALSFSAAADVPERVVGDPTRLGQVLSNLVSNAVKFTPEGRVDVALEVAEEGPDTVALRAVVADTGIGIDPEHLEGLFEPFRQADASTTRTFGGTGLGLAISRRLVVALGGELGVDSRPGEGSRFWFTARFARVGAPAVSGRAGGALLGPDRPRENRAAPVSAAPDTAAGRAGGARQVLVVEDNEINQMVAVGMLTALGYSVDVVDDGREAVRRAGEGRYDAVLMDLRMPQLDGYTAARMIRSQEPEGRRVPIIAMTASAVEGEQERCLAAGMDDFVTKPVHGDRLYQVLEAHLGRPDAPPVPEEPLADGSPAVPHSPAPRGPSVDLGRLAELDQLGERAVVLVNRAVDNFVQSVPSTLEALHVALATGDHADLAQRAHRLRGSALNLGAVRVADLSHELELVEAEEAGLRAPRLLEELHRAAAEAAATLTEHRLRAGRA